MKQYYLISFFCFVLTGCVSDDFNNMAEGLVPVTPRQAALMAADVYNAGDRRKGITLLATSPFGGATPYLTMYRDYIQNDPDPLVKAASIKALARFGDAEDALLIVPWLSRRDTDSSQVRSAAAIALQRLHNPSVVPALLLSLRDSDEINQVRASVATALGQYPENRVFTGLIVALQASDLSINLSAAQSLHSLTGQVFGIDWDAWYEWGSMVAETDQNIFEYMSVYEYPTYKHVSSWWDSITFWERRIHEKPGIPVGLKEASARSTYGDK